MEEYLDRFIDEYHLLKKKGFIRYFLLVHNLIDWCKENDILVGPGRGSVGCSLVAYIMKITNIDPMKFDLPLARFLNEERIDYPDSCFCVCNY